MTAKLYALGALALAGGAALVARHGRARTRAEMQPGFTAQEAGEAAGSLTFTQALAAGARALTGRSALGTQATLTIES